jgi:hypothetical protein
MLLCSYQTKQNVHVKFKNATSEDFKELYVNIFGEEYTFFNIEKGETTKPIHVKKSARYCYPKAITAKDTVICQPIDYVGEKIFTQGKLLMIFEIITTDDGKRYLIIK